MYSSWSWLNDTSTFLHALGNVSVINTFKHSQHIMVNVSGIVISKHHECMMDMLVTVFVILAVKCSQYVMDVMMNGFIMVSITTHMSRPLEANYVAISRWQRMHRSHSHPPPPHTCTSFAEMLLETELIMQHLLLKRTTTCSSS